MIKGFYAKKSVFITGCTGFVGKVILEKLLFDIPEIAKVFVLVRPKQNASAQTRFQTEIISSPCFDRLRSRYPNFEVYIEDKVGVIEGDLTTNGLGLSQTDRDTLTSTVEIVINSAASTEFFQRLDKALRNNTFGSLQVLELAKSCHKLQAFVQISTAYVNCNKQGLIQEAVYPIARDPWLIYKEISNMTLQEIEKNTPSIIEGFPNTYTFTKNLTEQLFCIEGSGVPLCIVRPTVVGASWREPYIGWVDSVSAAGIIYLTGGLGVLKSSMGRKDTILDQVPADFVSNCIICAAALSTSTEKISVIHIGTSADNPVSMVTSSLIGEMYWNRVPSKKQIARCGYRMFSNRKLFKIHKFVTRKVPGYMIQAGGIITQNSQVKNLAKKFQKLIKKERLISDSFEYFMMNNWVFSSNNLSDLRNKINPDEQDCFELDVKKIDWQIYVLNFCYGLHRFILKENVSQPCELEKIDLNFSYTRKFLADMYWASTHGQKLRVLSNNKLKSLILNSPKVQATIEELVTAETKPTNKQIISKRALGIIDNMLSSPKMPFIRFLAWALRKMWRNFSDKFVVDHEMLKKLKQYREEHPGAMVLIPSHRSYIDFLVMSYVTFQYKMEVPHISSSNDFFMSTALNYFKRSAGMFLNAETFIKDKLHRVIMREYLHILLQQNQVLELFIEGTRSKNGKISSPKTEMLSMCTEAYFEGRIDDLYLVPITLNYERVPEDGHFPFELAGRPNPQMSASKISKLVKMLSMNLGKIYVSVGNPISLKQYSTQHNHLASLNFMLANDIMKQIQDQAVIMPTALVATIILAHRRNVTEEELVDKAEWLKNEILLRNSKVGIMPNESLQTSVRKALLHLSNHLELKKINHNHSFSVKADYKSTLALSYYRNTMQHVFIAEALAIVSVLSLRERNAWIEGVSKEEFIEKHFFINSWLATEFFAQQTLSDVNTVTENLKMMAKIGLFVYKDNRIFLNRKLDFAINVFSSLLYPIIDCYWITFMFYSTINTKENLTIEKTVSNINWFGECLLERKLISFYESCSQETIRNALKAIQKAGILEANEKDSLVCLSMKYDKKGIQELADQFRSFRKIEFTGRLSDQEDVRTFLLSEFPVNPKL